MKKALFILALLILLCSCFRDGNSYWIVEGKDKSLQRENNSVSTKYILSIRNESVLRCFDFSVTVGYYGKVNVGDTIDYSELLLNLR